MVAQANAHVRHNHVALTHPRVRDVASVGVWRVLQIADAMPTDKDIPARLESPAARHGRGNGARVLRNAVSRPIASDARVMLIKNDPNIVPRGDENHCGTVSFHIF